MPDIMKFLYNYKFLSFISSKSTVIELNGYLVTPKVAIHRKFNKNPQKQDYFNFQVLWCYKYVLCCVG